MFMLSKLTGKTRKEIDEFWNLKAHLDIESLEMVDSRYNWSEPSNIALNMNFLNMKKLCQYSCLYSGDHNEDGGSGPRSAPPPPC